ncbi:MAG: hypothetical protein K6V97_08480 [Actinomycetia bacterium]|nr:hypothetical protein [Actinomycetes bacterium]
MLLAEWAISRLALALAGWAALGRIPWQYVSPTYNVSADPLVLMGVRWDAFWYIDIAARGYWREALAFFPLYPLLIAGLHAVLRVGYPVAALLVANVASLGVVGVLFALVRRRWSAPRALAAVTLLLSFPTAFYLAAAYAEPLFLVLVLLVFWFAERGEIWPAAACAALATLARNEGVFTVVPLLGAYAARYGIGRGTWLAWRRWWHPELAAVLAPAGALAAYMGWQWRVFGDPLAFLGAEAYWGRHLDWPWVGVVRAAGLVWAGAPLQPRAVLSMIDLVSTVGFVALWVAGWRQRLPVTWLAYWAFLLMVDVAAPDVTGESPLLSMSRLVLVIFPAFATMGTLAERPVYERLFRWVFPMLQAVFWATFVTWHWIA